MIQKKNAQPRNAELSAPSNGVNPTTAQAMTPRQARVLGALNSTTGWLTREAVDRIAGASNGPDVIRRLRSRFGHDAIDMERFDTVDRDGRPAKPGHYRLTDTGRRRLAEMGAK